MKFSDSDWWRNVRGLLVTRMSIRKVDITSLEIDAIITSTNSTYTPGGGIDQAIHQAAGPKLKQYCNQFERCKQGEAKIAPGFDLKSKYVILTVGPHWEDGNKGESETLAACYHNSLALAIENGLKKIAFPTISTGQNGFPSKEAALIAVKTVKEILLKNSSLESVMFVTKTDENFKALEAAFLSELGNEEFPGCPEPDSDESSPRLINVEPGIYKQDTLIVLALTNVTGNTSFSVPKEYHKQDLIEALPIEIGTVKIMPCIPALKCMMSSKHGPGFRITDEEFAFDKDMGSFVIASLPDVNSHQFDLVELRRLIDNALIHAVDMGCKQIGVAIPKLNNNETGQMLADVIVASAKNCEYIRNSVYRITLFPFDKETTLRVIKSYIRLITPDNLPLPYIRYIFKERFINFTISLPDQDIQNRSAGTISKCSWMIKYRFGIDESREWCEYYANTRFVSGDEYVRIYEDGEVIHLPSLCSMFSYSPGNHYEAEKKHRIEYEKLFNELTREGGILAKGPYSGSFLINSACSRSLEDTKKENEDR